MKIGDRIRERRKELGMSADDLAEKIGKNRATIYRYENGDIDNLPSNVLEPLAKALGTTPGELLVGSNDIPEYDATQQELIALYSRLNSNQKKMVLDLLRSFIVE